MKYRHEIVHLSTVERLTEREIARRLEIPRATVHYWLFKHYSDRPNQKRGARRKTDPRLDEAIEQLSLAHPFMTPKEMLSQLQVEDLSVATVRNRLKERGQKCCRPSRKPLLKDIHMSKRLAFATNYISWQVEDWKQVIFSDEKVFKSTSDGPLRVYRPRKSDRYDAKYIASKDRSNCSVCVFAAFGSGFRYIHWIRRKTLNSDYYTSIILPFIKDALQEDNLTFMQDLSPIHTSALTKKWFEDYNIPWMTDWPPKGPDMNPVENLWAELVRRIETPSTKQNELWEKIYAVFYSLPEAYFDSLIKSMPKRISEVKRKEGGWTKY